MSEQIKHWSQVEYLHESVANPYIHIRGRHSYYSAAWSGSFEQSVVRYLYGDEYSLASWTPEWEIDELFIGDYVCIGAEAVILMGGNSTHRMDWFSLYPFTEHITQAYQGKGNTHIDDGVWIGMRAMILPGIHIGEGAVVAAGSVVTKDVLPYQIVAGNPAQVVKSRFSQPIIEQILACKLYQRSEQELVRLRPYLCSDDWDALQEQLAMMDQSSDD